jgi:hypothetical protein
MSLRVKVVVITLLVIVFVVGALTSPWLIYYYRESQFNSARYLVESNGGGLSFGMVDGEYFLYLSNATDQTIDQLLPSLLNLPTGFTFMALPQNLWVKGSNISRMEAFGFFAFPR